MKNRDGSVISSNNEKNTGKKHPGDLTNPDDDSDKTSEDNNADDTIKKDKFSKSKLEIAPDSTGTDTKSDRSKKEKFPERPKE